MIPVTSTVVEQPTASSTIAATIPSGADGDLLVAYLLTIAVGTASQSTPATWTAGGVAGANVTTTNRLRSYWKERNGDTTVSFTLPSSLSAGLIVFNIPTEKRTSGTPGYTPQLGGHARVALTATTAPGTPSYNVAATNTSQRGLRIEATWNDDPTSTSTFTLSNSYDPVPPVVRNWTELARIDASGLDLVQVMAREDRPESLNSTVITRSGSGVNFGRINVLVFDEPQTKWLGALNVLGAETIANGVPEIAVLDEQESQSWATETSDKLAVDPGSYEVEARVHFTGLQTMGSTRTASIVSDSGVIDTDTVTLSTGLTPMVYLKAPWTTAGEDIWIVVEQDGEAAPRGYTGSFAISPAAAAKWTIGRTRRRA